MWCHIRHVRLAEADLGNLDTCCSQQKWRSMLISLCIFNSGALIRVSATGKYRKLVNCRIVTSPVIIGDRQWGLFLLRCFLACSVGGSDYGSVRAGAFMGRRIIQGMAASKESHRRTKDDNTFDVSSSLDSTEQYLCNIPPHRCRTPTVWSSTSVEE